MRIIHTADWHLGQYFYTKSRAAEHQAFLHWLITQVDQHQVDAIIVAGDIFDNGSPPSYAREMYYSFVVELQRTGCQLIVLGGNHDSVSVLNESRDLLACLNTRVIACASDDLAQQVLLLENRQQQPGALLCAIPYLRPRDVLTSKAGQSGDEKQLALQEAITAHYQQCYQLACQKRDALGLPLPIIATGHLTTIGATASESVRDIYIGTLDAFPAQAFPPADYIALGHIHRPQRVTKSDHIRYSGSPIPLSFDELGSEKSVCLVSFIPDAPPKIDTLPIPVTQPMQLIKGSLSDIEQQLATFQNYLGDKPMWLDIELSTQDYLSDMQKRIQAMTEHLPVEVLLLRRTREQRLQAITRQDKETLNELSVHDVFERRLATEKDMEDGRQQRVRTLFNQVINELENSEPAK
ncbi:exonuclease subunit SbcD [Pectobacterium wasabiae]|uniref:Nuclease SbcCD subunit D n=1 Tax=Pectobacterium wasabiae TaxID=55208 RepID=A0AAW3EKV1_9GAMM|nr:exonuclease subunit SbcD [Pectobacterium wasabiae]AOR64377.1 exonuclease subunit SbcD [Pectobacterium wasabiae CFBP 3304]EJS92476.1 Exonuclease subunit SbcD [Pectobacterium wasabiae CFBP 3304]KFX09131.1 exonuclease SbcD [Pectobacterium wasabiae]KGA29238.1 exonuclease SbcD [Pectobacterium wasabiae]